jgi:hypothetical protein
MSFEKKPMAVPSFLGASAVAHQFRAIALSTGNVQTRTRVPATISSIQVSECHVADVGTRKTNSPGDPDLMKTAEAARVSQSSAASDE